MQDRIPDYTSLVSLLPRLKRLPDALAETTLTREEAAKIQALGFVASEGRWQVPPVPPELVRDNPLLEHLSFRWDFRKTERQPPALLGSRSAPLRPREEDFGPTLAQIISQNDQRPSGNEPVPASGNATPVLHLGIRMSEEPCQREVIPQGPTSANARQIKPLTLLEVRILALLGRHNGRIKRRRLQQTCWRTRKDQFKQAIQGLMDHQLVVQEGSELQVTSWCNFT